MTETVPDRAEISAEFTWNAPSVFESIEAWKAEFQSVEGALEELRAYAGRLAEGPAVLVDALHFAHEVMHRRANKVLLYAGLNHHVDTTNQAAVATYSKARSLFSRVEAAMSFIEPELIAIGEATLKRWMVDEPRLAIYAHYFDNLFRQQAHVRSAEVEELLGMASDPFAGAQSTFSMLTNADFNFDPARTIGGEELTVTQGTLQKILAGEDREARRMAWENYNDTYLAFKNTLASNLATSIKQNVFLMHARRYDSTLEASLFPKNIPLTVFHNLIDVFRKHLPIWHRYWAIRRKALGVETLHPYDVWAPLIADRPQVTYRQAVDWIGDGMAPLGEEYVRALRKGCLEDRWVDVYPNRGKRAGAFSSGAPGTHPFIVMSYTDEVFSLSTLAHELGHSMHSYFSRRSQPVIYSRYSLFVAEVASNFNQAMVRAHLLNTSTDRALQIGLIEEALSNFHRYFFIMPTLARFELETHQRVERGEGLTADDLIDLMADLFQEGYGDEMHLDRQRVGITWATFGHMYSDYYVYQYATGISGAHALSRRILSGQPGAAEAYLDFLKAGNSSYPLDALKLAGVDLTTPQPVEETFGVLAGLIDRLESLL